MQAPDPQADIELNTAWCEQMRRSAERAIIAALAPELIDPEEDVLEDVDPWVVGEEDQISIREREYTLFNEVILALTNSLDCKN